MPAGLLFSESFDDAQLTRRNWYDGAEFRIVGDSWADQGFIEYEWAGVTRRCRSSGIRHSFEPTDEVCIRFYLKLSKGSTDFPAMKFNQFLMTPYFGPGLLPHPQNLWIEELAVGAKRMGPIPSRTAF